MTPRMWETIGKHPTEGTIVIRLTKEPEYTYPTFTELAYDLDGHEYFVTEQVASVSMLDWANGVGRIQERRDKYSARGWEFGSIVTYGLLTTLPEIASMDA